MLRMAPCNSNGISIIDIEEGPSHWLIDSIKTEDKDVNQEEEMDKFLDTLLQSSAIQVKEEEEPVAVKYEVTSDDHYVDDTEDLGGVWEDQELRVMPVEENVKEMEFDEEDFVIEEDDIEIDLKSPKPRIPKSITSSIDSPRIRELKNRLLGLDSLPLVCNVCYYRCENRRLLMQHHKIHNEAKVYPCSLCQWSGEDKIKLVAHIKAHFGQRLYHCSLCGYKSSHKGHTQRHLEKHKGKELLKCPLCDLRCLAKKTLQKHILSVHGPPPPLKCNLCDYQTPHKDHLKRHSRTHTGEKPYQCPHCPHRSGRIDHLKCHLKTHGFHNT